MIDELLGVRSALVVAPHPDDEALGCGGLLAALAERGVLLAVVFVTDGGASHPDSSSWPRPRLAALRAEEAAASLAALGALAATRLHLGLPDAASNPEEPAWTEAQGRLANLLSTLRPELILLPWRRDPHRDHRHAHRLTLGAIARAALRSPRLLEYPIWLDELGAEADRPQPGEVAVRRIDVGRWRERKRAAVAAHRSQFGLVIEDDPGGFKLSGETVRRLTEGEEIYFEASA